MWHVIRAIPARNSKMKASSMKLVNQDDACSFSTDILYIEVWPTPYYRCCQHRFYKNMPFCIFKWIENIILKFYGFPEQSIRIALGTTFVDVLKTFLWFSTKSIVSIFFLMASYVTYVTFILFLLGSHLIFAVKKDQKLREATVAAEK